MLKIKERYKEIVLNRILVKEKSTFLIRFVYFKKTLYFLICITSNIRSTNNIDI